MLLFYLTLTDAPEKKTKLEQIYNEYKRLMQYIAYEILKDNDLAEDAVHQAFLRIIRHLDGIEDISCHKTKAFIVIIIRCTAPDMLRKEKRQRVIGMEAVREDGTYSRDMTEDLSVHELTQIIKSLPEIYRDALELKVYYDLSDRELAEALGISYAAARKRLERARAALKKALKDRGE